MRQADLIRRPVLVVATEECVHRKSTGVDLGLLNCIKSLVLVELKNQKRYENDFAETMGDKAAPDAA